MSVVKSKRSKSSIEFEMLYFTLADRIDTMTEYSFYMPKDIMERNRAFVVTRSATLQKLTDELLLYIKVANSIYPQCLAEYEERRVSIDKAIGVCYAILTIYHRIMMRLKIKDNKYVEDIKTIVKMTNSLKAWRKSDVKLKTAILAKDVKK